ncbi:hypothetical protein G4Y79_07490 [Phototrophicus methaneseepsis]|uniref:Outer membrane protein beta-barrel domain-containing protein n=1 Tax=Phototrophicus methaneseepsis TaxID=2710758 RepID=A0A7S8IG26_9CHLR|nr:hypothetical protein [Phototrophicus methaneseepsis]QPC84207.1 hypothetical protein G4Y79_07490 [Phototrophicus methaneseepsis]
MKARSASADLSDQIAVETPQPRRRAFGGFTILKRATPGRTEWASWFDHNGMAPVTSDDTGGGGGGGYLMQLGHFVLNAGGSGQGHSRETESHIARLGDGQGFVDAGYVVVQQPYFRIFPLMGFGGFFGRAQIIDKSSLDDAILDKESLSMGAAGMYLGVGLDILIPVWRFRLVVGLRVGYRLANFGFNHNRAQSFDPNARGFFTRLIGGWERRQ